MKVWALLTGVVAMTVLFPGCDAPSRYRVLRLFFDGVPPPTATEAAGLGEAVAHGGAAPARRITGGAHGPYAAKQCGACHESAATNKLVLPRDELCFRCHDLQLNKKYIHGPLASGGCLACHDPHSSRYRYLLLSESDSFCFFCHDRAAVARIAGHEGIEGECTTCHDAHMSDKKYLLK